MQRRKLAAILQRVDPARARQDLVPILKCFCFDGETVTINGGVLMMQAPCRWDMRGGVDGGRLLNFLKHCRSEDDVVADVSDGDSVVVRLGQDEFRSKHHRSDEFVRQLPNVEDGIAIDVGDLLIDGLRKCSIGMSTDPANPWMLGVTLMFQEHGVTCYSSEYFAASRATVPRAVPEPLVGRSFILDPRFVKVLIETDGRDPISTMIIHNHWAGATFESGLVQFCRTISVADRAAREYLDLFEKCGADSHLETIPVPADLAENVRAVYRSIDGEFYVVRLAIIDDGNGPMVRVEQVATRAGSVDSVRTFAPCGLHDECQLIVPAPQIERVPRCVTEMAILEDYVLFRGQDFAYVVGEADRGEMPEIPRTHRSIPLRRWAASYITGMFEDEDDVWLPANDCYAEILAAAKEAGLSPRCQETVRLVARSVGVRCFLWRPEGPDKCDEGLRQWMWVEPSDTKVQTM